MWKISITKKKEKCFTKSNSTSVVISYCIFEGNMHIKLISCKELLVVWDFKWKNKKSKYIYHTFVFLKLQSNILDCCPCLETKIRPMYDSNIFLIQNLMEFHLISGQQHIFCVMRSKFSQDLGRFQSCHLLPPWQFSEKKELFPQAGFTDWNYTETVSE